MASVKSKILLGENWETEPERGLGHTVVRLRTVENVEGWTQIQRQYVPSCSMTAENCLPFQSDHSLVSEREDKHVFR